MRCEFTPPPSIMALFEIVMLFISFHWLFWLFFHVSLLLCFFTKDQSLSSVIGSMRGGAFARNILVAYHGFFLISIKPCYSTNMWPHPMNCQLNFTITKSF